MDDAYSTPVADQARRHSPSIERGTSVELLEEVISFSKDATRREWFERRESQPFWYERLDKDNLSAKLAGVADTWVQVRRKRNSEIVRRADISTPQERRERSESLRGLAAGRQRPLEELGQSLRALPVQGLRE